MDARPRPPRASTGEIDLLAMGLVGRDKRGNLAIYAKCWKPVIAKLMNWRGAPVEAEITLIGMLGVEFVNELSGRSNRDVWLLHATSPQSPPSERLISAQGGSE